MSVKSKMIIDCYYLLTILIDNRMMLGYTNLLNWLLKINEEMSLLEILEGLNQAYDDDNRLYSAEVKDLEGIAKISQKRSLENVIKLQDLRKETTDEELLLILNHLPCELFSKEIYKEYKVKFSEIEYQKICLIFEITIKEAKQDRFDTSFYELKNRIKQLVTYDLSELENLKK